MGGDKGSYNGLLENTTISASGYIKKNDNLFKSMLLEYVFIALSL